MTLGGADVGQREPLAHKTVKVLVHQGAGDFAGTVGAVVEENNAVVVGDGAVLVADHRHDKFVRHAFSIGICHCFYRVGAEGAGAIHHGIIGCLHTVPAFVAVHGVKPALDGGDFAHAQCGAPVGELLHIIFAGSRGHVAPVEECMHIDLGEALALCQLQ